MLGAFTIAHEDKQCAKPLRLYRKALPEKLLEHAQYWTDKWPAASPLESLRSTASREFIADHFGKTSRHRSNFRSLPARYGFAYLYSSDNAIFSKPQNNRPRTSHKKTSWH